MRIPLWLIVVACGAVGFGSSVAAQSPSASFAIDLDAGAPGVQSSLAVPVGASFHARVTLTDLGASAYVGYQVKITYDDALLDAAGLPASWGDAPTSVSGGNLVAFPSGPDCGPTPGADALQDGDVNGDTSEDDSGVNTVLMYCNDDAVAELTALQDLVDFFFTCESSGSAVLSLADLDDPQGGTNVTDDAFSAIGGDYVGATVNCGSGLVTSTPVVSPTAAVATPSLPTSVPVTPAPISTPQVVVGPSTGMGVRPTDSTWPVLAASWGLLTVGVGLTALGWRRKRES